MRIAMKSRIIGLATATLAAGIALGAFQGPAYLPVGEKAPPIEGTATDGKAYKLAELAREKPVFVIFWKERCPHNPRASALFNALNKAYEGKAQVFGIVNATPEGAKAWVDQFSVNYPMIPDAEKAAIKAYAMKYSIGTVQIGTDGKIAKVFEGYGAEQLQALNEAMAAAVGVKPAAVDLGTAPGRRTWG
jgi:peroxiredoxin